MNSERMITFFKKLDQKWYPVIAFGLTLLTVTLSFSMAQMLSNGKYTVLYGDFLKQYVPFARLYAQEIRQGNFSGYSWNVSMGQGTSLLYAFYSYSPFYLLFLLISDDLLASELVVLLRIATAALTCCLYLQKGRKEEGVRCIFFSVCYAMCSFQIVFFVFSDCVYLFPLVLLAIHYYLETKKISGLVMVYAASFVIHFYYGYLIGLFSFFYFVGLLWCRDGKGWIRKNGKLLFVYLIGVIAAILLSMAALCPAIMYYFDNSGMVDGSYTELKLLPTDFWYAMYLGRPFAFNQDLPYLYCGLPVLLLLPFYFTNQKISKKERITAGAALAALLLVSYIQPLYEMLHLFNKPDGYTVRYTFIIILLMVVIACRQCAFLRDIGRKKLFAAAAVDILFYFAGYLLNRSFFEAGTLSLTVPAAIANIVLILLWCVGLSVALTDRLDASSKVLAAIALLMMEMGLNAYWTIYRLPVVSEDEYRSWYKETEAALEQLKQEDQGIYRTGFSYYMIPNQQSLFDYMGVPIYASARNARLDSFMFYMGDAVGFGFFQRGANDVTDMLLSVKYYVDLQEYNPIAEWQIPEYYRMEHTLELGYMVSDQILLAEPYTRDVFSNQNQLLSAMTGEEIAVYREAGVPELLPIGMEWEAEGEGMSFSKAEEAEMGVLDYAIPAGTYEKAYAYFSRTDDEGGENASDHTLTGYTLTEKEFEVCVFSMGNYRRPYLTERLLYSPAIIEMERRGDQFSVRLIDYNEAGIQSSYRKLFLYYQDDGELKRAHEILSKNQWEIEEFQDGYVKAEIDVAEDKDILFLSIPYDKGWELLVDGSRQELLGLLDGSFLGARLSPGTHELILRYTPRGRKMGILLSFCGAGLWAILFAMDRKTHKKIGLSIFEKKYRKGNDRKEHK
ncbi:MAG: YfhO family protein [Lachnospiraceae bacterium]|nr:YfhO family protein [Lachnospiraceae bacterium]